VLEELEVVVDKVIDFEMGYDKFSDGSSLRLSEHAYVWLLFLGGLL